MSQNLVLMLLGGLMLGISAFSTEYVNYVKEGFRPFLIAAGAIILLIGVIGLVQDLRGRSPEHGHHHDGHHHKGPRVAWLLCLPAFVVLMISPPALGSFAASRTEAPPPIRPPDVIKALDPVKAAKGAKPIDLPLGEYTYRSWEKGGKSLAGKTLRLVGFVTPSKKTNRWYVTRMHMNCCAADAFAIKVAVLGVPQPAADSWIEVTGTPIKIKPDQIPQITAVSVRPVAQPEFPYE
jgi:uncharacterized repeat protein (TIGR03943 family)